MLDIDRLGGGFTIANVDDLAVVVMTKDKENLMLDGPKQYGTGDKKNRGSSY